MIEGARQNVFVHDCKVSPFFASAYLTVLKMTDIEGDDTHDERKNRLVFLRADPRLCLTTLLLRKRL